MSQGQITRSSKFGEFLYSICKNNENIKTVVEIGTWLGAGSTECIISGLIDSNKDGASFISFESNRAMYDKATHYWADKLPNWARLVHGRIVELEDMDSNDLGSMHQDEKKWFEEDKKALVSCQNIIGEVPQNIDFLFLDGGEFTTQSEFYKLENRSKIIALDDTLTRKCCSIRNHIINNKDKYKIIFDDQSIRNGATCFEVIKNKNEIK